MSVQLLRGDMSRARDRKAWFTRALKPTIAYKVNVLCRASPEATFEWIREPLGGCIEYTCVIYCDGSLRDNEHPAIGRTGWSFAATDADERVIAIARGLPPPWIKTSFGAEV